MFLKDFESQTDVKITKRGLEYFKSGAVASLEQSGGDWKAIVEGSEFYTVTVSISSNGEITGNGCDCPYEYGPVCKHQAAVFYAIREGSPKSGKKPAVQSLDEILVKSDKPRLVSILVELAERDDFIKNKLLLRFGNKKDMPARAKSLIKSSVGKVKRRGFVEYRDVDRAVTGAREALKLAESLKDGGDFTLCAEICFITAKEMFELMGFCDDSDGTAGGMVSEAIEAIKNMAEKVPEGHPDRDKLFRAVLKHADGKEYQGWSDWRLELLSACVPFCSDHAIREEFETYFLRMRMNGKKEGWQESYLNKGVQKIALDLISRFDGPEAAQNFIEHNLDNSDFRDKAVNKALEENNPERALKFCLEGEASDSEYPGLVNRWKKYRYRAYELMNHIPGQRELTLEFLKSGDFKYYIKLKGLYNKDEWPPVFSDLLKELEANPYGPYVDVLIHEDLKDLIFSYCRKHANALPKLYTHIIPRYETEAAEMFRKLIADRAERASSRQGYSEVRELIRSYAEVSGMEPAAAVVNALKQRYPRRPAFMDELNKL